MRRQFLVVIGIFAGLAVGAGGAMAASGGGGGHTKPASEAVGRTEAIGGGSATHARVAALINGNSFAPGAPPNFGVVRSVGVASVSNPADGTFCIRPQTSVIPVAEVAQLIPTVAATFSGSAQHQAFAQYVSPRPPACAVGTIAVFTFSADLNGNLDVADNDVGFTVVVD